MAFRQNTFMYVLILGIVLQATLGCFITNCPPGGKRSGVMSYLSSFNRRQCMTCGPASQGRCFGSSICCGDSFGCYINTEESSVCRKENYIGTPCANSGVPCGFNDKGICAANGVCCTESGCSMEDKCLISPAVTGV